MDLILITALIALLVLVGLFAIVLRAGARPEEPEEPDASSSSSSRLRRPRRRVDQEDPTEGAAVVKLTALQAAKQAKKEARARETSAREAMVKVRQKERDEFWAEKDPASKQAQEERARQAEEDKRLEVEMERRDQEQYEEWKEKMNVEESGELGSALSPVEDEGALRDLVEQLKRDKVGLLESLAVQRGTTARVVADQLAELERRGELTGVLDPRGRFVVLTDSELDAVAAFIRQRGRVSLAEVAANSNRLVDLSGA